jgi:carbon-monoxide dehydrogenase medium subunit
MIPGRFEYHAPSSLDEVISLLSEHEDARVIAGGHNLLPMMKLRFAEPATPAAPWQADPSASNGG